MTPLSSPARRSSSILSFTMRGARRPYQARQARAYMTAASSLVNSMNSTRFSLPHFGIAIHRATNRQPIQPVEQVAHRPGHPETVSPCCWNSPCREGCRDGIRRGYAARPYLSNDRGERGSARICFRRGYPTGSLASLRRCHCFDRHYITVTCQPRKTPASRKATVGVPVQRPFHRGSVMEAPGLGY
jgi:hypothetical protein